MERTSNFNLMNTLKDEIRDVVMDYHNEKDVAPDPKALIEAIYEILVDKYLAN